MASIRKETVKSLVEMLDERPPIDNNEAFNQLFAIYNDLRRTIDARFTLTVDDSCADFMPYDGLPGTGAKGFLSTWTGPGIDWMVHSWVGNPQFGFSNMHFTVWLGPETDVPHLAFALGTVPDLFFYLDFLPRVDMSVETAYLDRYYEPNNARALELRQNPDLTLFVSKSLYVRQVISENALCYTCKHTPENIALIRTLTHDLFAQWLGWLNAAEPTPPETRPALAARDLAIRRNSAERDPANAIGVRLFGAELTERLVRGLWGGDRTSPRPRIEAAAVP
jgi:hypothetical protein